MSFGVMSGVCTWTCWVTNDVCATNDLVTVGGKLAAVAEAVQAAIRPRDLAGRFGGEEFVVLLADTQPTAAAGTAERIRKRVEELDCRAGPAGTPVRVTISLGVACLSHDLPDLPGLLDAADAALYAAKAAGRNRVSPPTSRGNRGKAAVPVA
jgi:diguanylate cyclase (GGDEF)-like protein